MNNFIRKNVIQLMIFKVFYFLSTDYKSVYECLYIFSNWLQEVFLLSK